MKAVLKAKEVQTGTSKVYLIKVASEYTHTHTHTVLANPVFLFLLY